MAILVYAEHDNAELKPATLNAVTAALAMGGDIALLIAGDGCDAVAEAAVFGVPVIIAAYRFIEGVNRLEVYRQDGREADLREGLGAAARIAASSSPSGTRTLICVSPAKFGAAPA